MLICTVSGKGGTGKSTVSSGLAAAAANMGKKVLLIDLDASLRCLDIIFGIDDKIVFDLSDAIKERDLKKAVYRAALYDNVFIVPAPDSGRIDFNALNDMLKSADSSFDFIILDFPAGADFENYAIFGNAQFIVVSGADSVSVRDAAVISNGIKSDTPPRLIINRFDRDMIKYGIHKNIDGIIDASSTRLLGIVPADGELLTLSVSHGLKPRGRAMRAFTRIIKRVSGEDVRLPKLKKI